MKTFQQNIQKNCLAVIEIAEQDEREGRNELRNSGLKGGSKSCGAEYSVESFGGIIQVFTPWAYSKIKKIFKDSNVAYSVW